MIPIYSLNESNVGVVPLSWAGKWRPRDVKFLVAYHYPASKS